MSVRRTIARNTIFNALGRLWEALLGLGLTIYIVERIAFNGFGLWSLVAAFTGYAALFDFGVSSAFTKYIAEHAARDDDRAVSSVVSTGVAFYAVLGIVLVGVGWPAIDLLITAVVRLLSALHPAQAAAYQDAAAVGDIRFLFRGALVIFAFTNCVAPFSAIPAGLQRMGVTNLLSFAASLLKLAATILFLEMGYGVRGLLYTNAVVLAAFGAASAVVAYYLYPRLRVGWAGVRRDTFRILFQFGWRTQVAKLSNLINFQTDRAVVAVVFADLTLVGLYRAAEEAAMKFRQLPALIVSALIPAVSDLDARKRHDDLAELYLRSTKYIAVVTLPLAVFTLAAAEMLLRVMFGGKPGLDTAAWVMRILVLGYGANLLPGPGVSIALGKGRADLPMYAGLISMFGNIALTLLLVYALGFYGVPMGTSLAMFISTAWFFAAMRRTVSMPLHRLLLGPAGWPLLACAPGFLLCAIEAWFMSGYQERLPNLIAVGAGASAFCLFYASMLYFTPFLDAFDVDFLEKTLKLGALPGFAALMRRARHV